MFLSIALTEISMKASIKHRYQYPIWNSSTDYNVLTFKVNGNKALLCVSDIFCNIYNVNSKVY